MIDYLINLVKVALASYFIFPVRPSLVHRWHSGVLHKTIYFLLRWSSKIDESIIHIKYFVFCHFVIHLTIAEFGFYKAPRFFLFAWDGPSGHVNKIPLKGFRDWHGVACFSRSMIHAWNHVAAGVSWQCLVTSQSRLQRLSGSLW